jgi:hypothetical protein
MDVPQHDSGVTRNGGSADAALFVGPAEHSLMQELPDQEAAAGDSGK